MSWWLAAVTVRLRLQPVSLRNLALQSPSPTAVAPLAGRRKKNREKVDQAAESGQINLLLSTNVTEFTEETVTIDKGGEKIEIPNDAAIICAGGILPTGFLKETGINVETKHGTA